MVRDALVGELGDISEAIGALNQSYNFRGIDAEQIVCNGHHAQCSGSGFNDELDDCDCVGVQFEVVLGKNDPSELGTAEGT